MKELTPEELYIELFGVCPGIEKEVALHTYWDMLRFAKEWRKSSSIEQMPEIMYKFGKLVLDTFHSEGKTESGGARLPRVKFDEWFKLEVEEFKRVNSVCIN